MHFLVYVVAGVVLISGIVLAGRMDAPFSYILVVQSLISAILLATFGRIEQHLSIIARHFGDGPTAPPQSEILTGHDATIGESGVYNNFPYSKTADGKWQVSTAAGFREFDSLDEAKKYMEGR